MRNISFGSPASLLLRAIRRKCASVKTLQTDNGKHMALIYQYGYMKMMSFDNELIKFWIKSTGIQ